MRKSKRISLTIFIALVGIVFEILNYYVFAVSDKWYIVGFATAGLYIFLISIFGNIMFNYYLNNKKGERK